MCGEGKGEKRMSTRDNRREREGRGREEVGRKDILIWMLM